MVEKPIDYYDDPSFDYHHFWETRRYEDQSERIALKKLLFLIKNKKEKAIIDIGAGFGRLTPIYAPLFKNCLLVEPSEKLLTEAKRINQEYNNLNFKESYVEKLPAEKESFDVALMVRVSHHLEDLGEMIKEVKQILKPHGYFIMEYANKRHLKNFLVAIFKLGFSFFNHLPENLKTKRGGAPFFNYHPNQINSLLLSHDFKILKRLSVSNFRSPFLKKIIPISVLIWLEKIICPICNYFRFGPSIFLLLQKK